MMIPRQKIHETVLYYSPEKKPYEAKLKGVLVRMGIRIRNVSPDQIGETVGALAGLSGCEMAVEDTQEPSADCRIDEEVLVMHNFSGFRMDELFLNLRKAGVPKIALKAVVTETNCRWTFCHLYREIREEHEKMTRQEKGE